MLWILFCFLQECLSNASHTVTRSYEKYESGVRSVYNDETSYPVSSAVGRLYGDYGSSALGGYSGYRIWACNSWQNMLWTLSDFETTIQGRKSSWDVVSEGSWKCPPLLICHHQLNSCKFWVWRKKHKQMRWNICSLPISFFSEFIWQLHFSYCHRNYIAKINKQKQNEFLYEKPRCFLDWNDVCPKYSHTIYMETKWFFHNQFEVSLDYLVLVKIQSFYFFYPWIILSCSFYYPH